MDCEYNWANMREDLVHAEMRMDDALEAERERIAQMADDRAAALGAEAAAMPERGPEWRNALSRAAEMEMFAKRIRENR